MIDHTSGYANPAFLLNDARWGLSKGSGDWQTITSAGINQPEPITASGYDGGNPAAARDLMEAIQQDRQPLCSMYEARGAIEMVLAVFESHRLDAPVRMPLDCRENPLALL